MRGRELEWEKSTANGEKQPCRQESAAAGQTLPMSSDNQKGLGLAVGSSLFIGASFIIKKKGLKRAGASGVRAGLSSSSTEYLGGGHGQKKWACGRSGKRLTTMNPWGQMDGSADSVWILVGKIMEWHW